VTRTARRTVAAAFAGLVMATVAAAPARADTVRDAQWHLGFIDVAHAHQISQGDNVVVGLIDSGVDASHPDLAGNILPGTDLLLSSGNGWHDSDGHGTRMAGLIAAHGHAGGGALGIAPLAKILPAAATGMERGSYPVVSAAGITWAVDHGAKVLCLAFAGDIASADEERAVRYAQAHDVVVVAGVGNRPQSTHVGYPAAFPGVLAAGGVDRNGGLAEVSVTGPQVVLAAPAVDIESTAKGGKYSKASGTSDATAIIAGAAALVRAKFPNLSAAEVVHRLTATAKDAGPPGRDDQYGYGIVNLVGALTADVPKLTPSAVPSTSAPASAGAAPKQSNRSPLALVAILLAVLLAAAGAWVLVRHRGTRAN
jgi:type VII secretion-associated serine protease mycosin